MFCPEPMVSFRSRRKFSSYLVRTKLYPLQSTVCSFKCYKSSYQVCLNVYLKTLLLVLWLSRLNHKFITAVINVWFIYFHFFCLRPEIPFLLYMVQKIKFKLKFDSWTNSNMKNSMVMFNFSVFDQKYSFWENLDQKFKIICSKWNLIPRPIRISRI